MGTIFQVPWTFLQCSITEYTSLLHQLGFSLAAMALRDDSVDIDDDKLNSEERLAVIMGTEGDGLADLTIASCDHTVKIPMYHGVDSLNVAAASAVAFWQLGRRRK
jgi:tRNA G18 (ribose-2'-O)-methylase SpoU